MKILQVITSLQIGGAEKLVAEISPMLHEKGHEVDVLAFDGADTAFKKALTDKGIKVYSFGKGCNVYNPLFIFRLAKMMKMPAGYAAWPMILRRAFSCLHPLLTCPRSILLKRRTQYDT